MPRDEFSAPTPQKLGDRVGLICSNPLCRVFTKGAHSDRMKAASMGRACHIHAAAPGGPRYDPSQTPEERASIENGIWLCSNCAALIDSDPERFPAELVRAWRTQAEQRSRDAIGTVASGASAGKCHRDDGTIDVLTFELERLRDAADERGRTACRGPWTALSGATYDGAQLKRQLERVLQLLAPNPSARTLLRELLHLLDVANATAASIPPTRSPNQVELRELRHRSAEAAEKIHVTVTQLLGCVSPGVAATEAPAFVALLEEEEQRTRHMQEVFWRMNNGPKITRQSDQETRRAGVPYRVRFNGQPYEVGELLALFDRVVTDASSPDDEFAFWALLNATRTLRVITWDLLKTDLSCPWSKDAWMPVAERFAAMEQAHGESVHRFWDEAGEARVYDERGQLLGTATYIPGGKANGPSDPGEGLLMAVPPAIHEGGRYAIDVLGRRVGFIAERTAGGGAFIIRFR